MGWRWKLKGRDLAIAFSVLAGLALALIPLGMALKFIHWSYNPLPPSLYLSIFLFALVEEILFRGVMQNLFEKRLRNGHKALLVASLIFGISHLNNVSLSYDVPNIPYAVMATVAGLGYGFVWMRTRSVVASALTHTAVNVLWKIFFV